MTVWKQQKRKRFMVQLYLKKFMDTLTQRNDTCYRCGIWQNPTHSNHKRCEMCGRVACNNCSNTMFSHINLCKIRFCRACVALTSERDLTPTSHTKPTQSSTGTYATLLPSDQENSETAITAEQEAACVPSLHALGNWNYDNRNNLSSQCACPAEVRSPVITRCNGCQRPIANVTSRECKECKQKYCGKCLVETDRAVKTCVQCWTEGHSDSESAQQTLYQIENDTDYELVPSEFDLNEEHEEAARMECTS